MDENRNGFCLLERVYSERLLASWWYEFPEDRAQCSVNPGHQPLTRRALEKFQTAQVNAEVNHNRRDEPVIWTSPFPRCLVHSTFAAEMRSRGYTGYTFRSATVRFRDGYLSHDYRRLVVTGWGGLARPSSGIRIRNLCSGCDVREYSPLTDPKLLVDIKQWDGSDFFVVWPLSESIVVTQRVATLFQSAKLRSCAIRPLLAPPSAREIWQWKDGLTVIGLAAVFPKALAAKYRRLPEIV